MVSSIIEDLFKKNYNVFDYFSIVDMATFLTESTNPQAYWRKLKQRLTEEGNQTVTNCHAFKMKAADGKMRLTDVADQEQFFRLIQSIPSPKAEPFKQWMVKVAAKGLDLMQGPVLSIDQAIMDYKRFINKKINTNERRNPQRFLSLSSASDGVFPV
jgi:hypothetical protein